MSTIGAVFTWILFGLVVGLVGRLLVPGRQPMGWLSTMVLGIIGSFAGGFLGALFTGGDLIQPANFVLSIVGAVVVLAAYLSFGAPKRI